MAARVILVILVGATLAGCAGDGQGSGLNPFNWFRPRPQVETLVPLEREVFVDRRPLVGQVLSAQTDRLPGGVIVRAEGLAPEQGYWQADLVPAASRPVSGMIDLQFRTAPHPQPQPVGTPRTRRILAATFFSTQDLRGVRAIRVIGQTNALSTRP